LRSARATILAQALAPRARPRLAAPAQWIGRISAHVAFRAKDHAAIQQFHAEGLKAAATMAARARADYSPTYYAAFLIDPDGNNVEAVCT
jgi:hypothetical protein